MAERALKPSNRANRPRRVPVSGSRDILTIDKKEDGFEYRIVKDKKGRIDRFEKGGWEVVHNSETKVGDVDDKNISEGSPVKIDLGRGETGYLMRIPSEYYQEDQNAKEQNLRAKEQQMHTKATQDYYGRLDIQHKRGLPPE